MKTIAWDVDDVLNDLMKNWFELFKKTRKLEIKFPQIKENPPHRILGISLNEYLQSLDEFRLSKHYQKMKPLNTVLEWFENYGYKFRHIALTATPLNTAPTTAQWVLRNFGRWIRTFHFVPSKRQGIDVPEYDRDKSDFFRWLGKIDFFIDDNPENVKKMEQIGIKTILWRRPWNDAKKSWQEALDELNLIER